MQEKQIEERNIEKHTLTNEELNFLINLQHELNTQDTISQADPRFWVVAGTKKDYTGVEYMDGSELITHDRDGILADGMEEAVKYFQEIIEERSEDDEEYGYILEKETQYKNLNMWRVVKFKKNCNANTVEDYNEGDEIAIEHSCISDIGDLINALEDIGIINQNEYDVAYYRNEDHIYPDTMFITNKSCKEHIKLNHYHYDANAHSYAMTAWRSPEIEKLWNILQTVDWSKIKENRHQTIEEKHKQFVDEYTLHKRLDEINSELQDLHISVHKSDLLTKERNEIKNKLKQINTNLKI